MTVTHSRLLELVDYDRENGLMVSRVDRGSAHGGGRKVKKGQVLGGINNKGYLQTTIDGRTYLVHRLAWMYETGEFPSIHLDHIDGNRSNNAINNLRECVQIENNQNLAKKVGNCTSRHIGVCYAKAIDCWVAYIRFNGRQVHRYVKTERDAVLARAELKKEFHKFNPADRGEIK